MSTTILYTLTQDELFKHVAIVCFDRKSGKYRSLNFEKRTIAAPEYNSVEEVVTVFQILKSKGQIHDFEIVTTKKELCQHF